MQNVNGGIGCYFNKYHVFIKPLHPAVDFMDVQSVDIRLYSIADVYSNEYH